MNVLLSSLATAMGTSQWASYGQIGVVDRWVSGTSAPIINAFCQQRHRFFMHYVGNATVHIAHTSTKARWLVSDGFSRHVLWRLAASEWPPAQRRVVLAVWIQG